MSKYSIGVDFGTLSARALIVDIATGKEIATAANNYKHAVIDETMVYSSKKLPPDFALQHPQDYIDSLESVVKKVLDESKIEPSDIIGLGIDFTACTVLPVYKDGSPLCFSEKHKENPHAYIKLWKHHAAQKYATLINETAEKMGETWLKRYGGKISSEWLFAKILQVLEEAPEIYNEADYFIEAADWVIWQLTGVQTRNSCTAGYKAMWHKRDGYPTKEFFKSLNPKFENVVEDKLNCPVISLGTKAGEITKKAADLLGLKEKTAVAVGNVDAHVTFPAVGLSQEGDMLAIMGTSSCHMLLGKTEMIVPGMCGVVEDGILPGFFGYEAGQSCVGDHFAWFVDNFVGDIGENKNKFEYIAEKSSKLKPGESGLIALDWWNGNRSVLVDIDLTGLFIGMTLLTKPEEMFRALVEATAYGTRMIVETFKENNIDVKRFFAAGGIAEKDPFTMQIYSDVINMPIKIAGSAQAPALGSAIFGAVAAGSKNGGYDTIDEASQVMSSLSDRIYTPNPENVKIYDKLYAEYKILHDYFGRACNDVMKRLKEIKANV
ncbi:MAG: ribulokinase [Oscillospiraceae bacterium]|nr:ribulokinase [Oscillospiraceae bacterium]